ncbi:MAG: hypothetical protein KKD97_16375 [Gammaproteobacteria bacterium]|nr:hypothetical protein [Gammaproteobacteria bacterium]
MSSLIQYVDVDGQEITAVPVVIIGDRTLQSQTAGSKTDYIDEDGRLIRATPLVIMEDFRPNQPGVGGNNYGPYMGPAESGGNDTAILQEFIDDMSASARVAKRQLKVVLPVNGTYLVDGLFVRSNIDIDLNGSTLKKIRNADYSGAGALTARGSILCAELKKTGNTWYGNADNITVRNGVLDANNQDTLAVLDLYNVRNFVADGLTLITSQWSRNWATRGGGYARMLNGRILGQAGLYQDGAHWQYGGCVWDNWYIEAGDDALAAGDDRVRSALYMDDQGLDYFIARNITCVSARGAAIKVYTPVTKAFSGAPENYTKTGRVQNVDVQVSGKSGLLRNGGVSIFSHAAAGFRNPDDLRAIRIHADLEVGTAGNAVWDAVSGVIVGSPTAVTQAAAAVVTLNNHGLTAGKVVHLIPAIGGMNALNGFYQVMPANLTANTFQLSDIAYRDSAPLNTTGYNPWTTGLLVAVGSGVGYAVGDEINPAGGTYVRQAKFLVTQVDANGAVQAVRRLDEGEYSVLPATPNSPTGGSGAGCTLQLFMQHDGVNAYGVKSVAGKSAEITGHIRINDTTGAATRFRSFWISDSEGITLRSYFPLVPAGGGLVSNDSAIQLSKGNTIACRMVCGPEFNASMSPVMLSNSADTLVTGAIENIPPGVSGVSFPVNGNSLHPRNIAAISGSENSVFQVAHGNWKAGQIVRIYNNVLSTGTLDGYYYIRRVYGDSSFGLRKLTGELVGLGNATVVGLGNIEVANNTAKLVDLTFTPAPNTDNHVGVGAAAISPYRVSALAIVDCKFPGIAMPISQNVTAAPVGYVARDNRL